MSASINAYRNPAAYNRVRLGGVLIKAILTKINGNKIEDEWKVQKSKETNGAVAVFAGTKILEAIELTFEAPDEETFDDLDVLWDLLAPKPGIGSAPAAGTSTTGTAAPTYAIGSPPAGSGSGTASGTIPDPKAQAAAANAASGGKDAAKAATPDPGPRPPTLTIENEHLRRLGCTAVARKSWEGPNCTAENSWEVKITLIQNKPPTPAGTGAQAAPVATDPAAQIASGAGGASPQAKADDAKTQASQNTAAV